MKNNTTRKNLNFLDFLAQVPWWLYATISGSAYILIEFIAPILERQGSFLNEVHGALGPAFAPVVALALLAPASFSLLRSNRKKNLLDLKDELQAIQALSLKQMEGLLAEAFSRTGYLVIENTPLGTVGGVDLVLRKSANLYFVQFQHWKDREIGVQVVRDMYTRMYDRQASGVIIITSGVFTREVLNFAAGKPIDLIDGRQLVELIGSA
jgi:restriction system protein